MKQDLAYKVCSKTVIDSSDPSATFDEDGICNYFWDFEKTVKPNWRSESTGPVVLRGKLEEVKAANVNREYDCILGLSGGADSSYMLHKAVRDFGLRPLVFHVDGGWNSELAVSNISALVEQLNLDLYTEVINWDEMRDFQLAMFKSGVPGIDIPQDLAFIGVLYKFAEKYKIKTILNGGNISTECVPTPKKYHYFGTDLVYVRDILRKHGTVPMTTYPFSSAFYHKLWLRYFRGVRLLKPLNYIPYVKAEAMAELENIYGWRPYPQKHFESRFTRFYEGYWLPTRFGYDMRRREFSSLILTGQMTREQALKRLEQPPLDLQTATQEFDYVASKLGISTEELRGYHQMPKKYYSDYRNQDWLFNLGEKVLGYISGTRRGGAV
jgi:N-acetyl sugar amidotransferase